MQHRIEELSNPRNPSGYCPLNRAELAEGMRHSTTIYLLNIHYRCEESGNCTLVTGGATAIAKLTR
jgi:hypothetical protein